MKSKQTLYKFSHPAMATYFDVYIQDKDKVEARHASRAVFEEIDRLEQQLSYFIPWSDISQINRLQPGESVIVGSAAFECLELAKQVYSRTNGAFDPTVGALLKGRQPWDRNLQNAIGGVQPLERQHPLSGLNLVKLDPVQRAVAIEQDGIALDLGGIAKGYAIDQAVIVLEDWGVECAMLSAGQSTFLPIGGFHNRGGWPMRFLNPGNEEDVLGHFEVENFAVSASSDIDSDHILDPSSETFGSKWMGTWTVTECAAEADALSTAFMVMEKSDIDRYCAEHPDTSGAVVELNDGEPDLICFGDWSRFSLRRVERVLGV